MHVFKTKISYRRDRAKENAIAQGAARVVRHPGLMLGHAPNPMADTYV